MSVTITPNNFCPRLVVTNCIFFFKKTTISLQVGLLNSSSCSGSAQSIGSVQSNFLLVQFLKNYSVPQRRHGAPGPSSPLLFYHDFCLLNVEDLNRSRYCMNSIFHGKSEDTSKLCTDCIVGPITDFTQMIRAVRYV